MVAMDRVRPHHQVKRQKQRWGGVSPEHFSYHWWPQKGHLAQPLYPFVKIKLSVHMGFFP